MLDDFDKVMQASLESITGNLITIYKQIHPDTIRHASEIMRERQINEELRKGWYWTADFPMYIVENGKAILYFAPRQHNLIFQNMNDAIKQIKETKNYKLKQEDISKIVESTNTGETLRIELSRLNLKKYDEEWNYFDISTASYEEDKEDNYDNLNKDQRIFAERIYCEDDEFRKNMRILREINKKIKSTRIYVLAPEYVKKNAEKTAISRISSLGSFNYDSGFNAVGWSINDCSGFLRGIYNGVKINGEEVENAFKILIRYADKITPQMYANILESYLTRLEKS